MFGLGFPELLVILLIVFLLFGPKALPDIARGLGETFKKFKKETKEIRSEIDSVSEAVHDQGSSPPKSETDQKQSG